MNVPGTVVSVLERAVPSSLKCIGVWMDERIFRVKIGHPIPDWDFKHRLGINRPVAPECKDSATTHRINSNFMDVSEQPHMSRQWVAAGTLIAINFFAVCVGFCLFFYGMGDKLESEFWLKFSTFMVICGAFGFGYVACKYGRDELFSLTRRPIRFHRVKKKIYAIRRRRFFSSASMGDITWEVPWSEHSIFCIHRGPQNSEHESTYHIRYYEVDKNNDVVRGFAIGREWHDIDGMNDLLCQWNYWCWYTNNGPQDLPKPLLFLTEKESLYESFLYCMYDFGFSLHPTIRKIMLPYFSGVTLIRLAALWTCRAPIWPSEIKKISQVGDADPYNQPAGNMPIGWAETLKAHVDKTYPSDPRCCIPDWTGEPDAMKNAHLWMGERSPQNF
jgi:hypothetical protein